MAGVHGKPDVFYFAQVNGGIWKSDDAGRTWNPIFDGQRTQSIGALAVAPSDSNVIYAGSGEGLLRPDVSVGNGMYKSTDAGRTWRHMGLDDAQQIGNIAVDPRDANRVFAAVMGHPFGPSAPRGVYRSTDGGTTWQRVLFKDENSGANDVEIDPANPETLYAALWESRLGPSEDNNKYQGTGGGIFKSTDGGATWRQLKNGLPANAVQFDIAVAPNDPRRLYVVLGMSPRGGGFYRSDDGGETWTKATDDSRPTVLIGGGDLPGLRVDPQNPDVVYSASIVAMKSTDGGHTWISWRGAPGGDDYQNLWIDPTDSNTILMASDQGTVVTLNGGRTWSSWYNQPTAQLYHVGVTPTFPYRICSGQQESGSVCIASRGDSGAITFRDWRPVGTIEYGYVAPDPVDPDIVMGGGRNEVTRFRWSTGQVQDVTPLPVRGKHRVTRTEPVIFSPADPTILYYAAETLFRTKDRGDTWQTISPDLTRPAPGVPASVGRMAEYNKRGAEARGSIYAVAPGVKDVNTIWVGTDDGLLWITRDGGANWSNITPPALTPWSKVTQIDASHFDNDTAYVSVSRFRVDDLKPYIYRTHDGGRTWKLIVSGLLDSPVNTVREDPVRPRLLYAGTETAVWVSLDDGERWQSLQRNLPATSMRDLLVHQNDLIVATHGRSFWVLDDITPLRQLPVKGDTLFKPANAVRVRRSLNTDTPLPADEPIGENPPDGAVIDYYLAATAADITIEIADSSGNVIRRFTSNDKPFITPEELAKQAIPPYWVATPVKLATNAGMHRWVWDLRLPAPASGEPAYPISAVPGRTPRSPEGPLVVPGTYTVRLVANGKTSTAPLTVVIDPRVRTSTIALTQLFELEKRVYDMLDRTTLAIREKTAAAQAKKEEAPAPPQPDDAPTIESVRSELSSLYSMLNRADVAPTAAQIEAVDAVAKKFEAVTRK